MSRPSAYEDETFARYWDERAGDKGEIYKRLVLDPLMFGLIGSLKNKTVLEMGCGNGYLGPVFLTKKPSRVIMMDISEANLAYARQKTHSPKVSFLRQDATTTWHIPSASIDVVYSNMMLNEVDDIETPLQEAYRTLRPGGVIAFSVTHPSWNLYVYAQEKAGIKSEKMIGLGNYFHRGNARYIMGHTSNTNPTLSKKYGQEFSVDHYQRPLADYFSGLSDAGFIVKNMLEPELTPELLTENPRFETMLDHPVSAIFYAIKQ